MGNPSVTLRKVELNPIYKDLVDKLIQEMERGIIPWLKPWFSKIPKNLATKKKYRGINVFNLLDQQERQGYQSHSWVTQKQAVRLNRKIKETEIESPQNVIMAKWYSRKWTDKIGEEHIECWLLTRSYEVYNEDQLVAIPRQEKLPFRPKNKIKEAESVIRNYEDKPVIFYNQMKAFYRPIKDEIGIPSKDQFSSPEEYYGTLFHEYAHSTGHRERLDRDSFKKTIEFGDKVYAKEELVAELASAFLCCHCGFYCQTKKNTAAYLQSWLKALKKDYTYLFRAASKAQNATDLILGMKFRQMSNEPALLDKDSEETWEQKTNDEWD